MSIHKEKNKKGLKTFGIIVLVLLIILAIIVGGTFAFVHSKLSKMKQVDLNEDDLPLTENLADTEKRVLQEWNENIVPNLKKDKKIIISAHGNTLRALVRYLDNISSDGIADLNIPTGTPLVYELDDDLKPIKSYYLSLDGKVSKDVMPKHI